MIERHPSIRPSHPGRMLREYVLPDMDRPKTEIARLLGISRANLYDLLNEKISLSPEMAVKIGKLCGNGPRLWMNMQADYDLWHAQRAVDTSSIPTLGEAS